MGDHQGREPPLSRNPLPPTKVLPFRFTASNHADSSGRVSPSSSWHKHLFSTKGTRNTVSRGSPARHSSDPALWEACDDFVSTPTDLIQHSLGRVSTSLQSPGKLVDPTVNGFSRTTEDRPSLDTTSPKFLFEQRPPIRPSQTNPSTSKHRPNAKHDPLSLNPPPRPERRSAFVEGSMTQNSRGVASSWLDSESDLASSVGGLDEILVKPEVSQGRKTSIDNRGSKTFPSTPSTLREVFTSIRKTSKMTRDEESSCLSSSGTSTPTQKSQPHSLRSSLSNFSLLGSMSRFFGNDASNNQNSNTAAAHGPLNALEDRKRKTEEGYALKFGLKKQKSNFGIASVATRSPEPKQRATLRKRTPTLTATSRPSSSAHDQQRSPRRNISSPADSLFPILDPQSDTSFVCIDRRKKLSRAELEKENQQLRALLRESQSRRSIERPLSAFSIHSNKSSVYLPLDDPSDVVDLDNRILPPPRSRSRSPRSESRRSASRRRSLSPEKSNVGKYSIRGRQYRETDVPSVPALPAKIPERNILVPINGNQIRTASTKSSYGTSSLTSSITHGAQSPKHSPTAKASRDYSYTVLQKSVEMALEQDSPRHDHVPKLKPDVPILLPHSLSMVCECDENDPNGAGNMHSLMSQGYQNPETNTCLSSDSQLDPAKKEEHWEWPDDVF